MRFESLKNVGPVFLGLSLSMSPLFAQTAGQARLEVNLLDYNGSGTRHYTVAWITTQSGTFIKTLRRQGPLSWNSNEWGNHCTAWNNARAGSTVLDGYTSATAPNYAGTNNPVILTWDGRDANNKLMPDGNYKFWVQYAENQSSQGPVTTGGLLWTKGPNSEAYTYPNQGANFTDMRVVWSAVTPPPPPKIASVRPSGNDLVLTGTGPANTAFSIRQTAELVQPIWAQATTGSINAAGTFQVTIPNALSSGARRQFYRLTIP